MQKRVKIKFKEIKKTELKGSKQIFYPSTCLKNTIKWGIDKIKA